MYEVSEAYRSAIAQPSRNFRLSGNIRMQSGDTITLSDNNVVGEMKIETRCMSGSSSEQMLDIGAVCAAKLTMTVKNASGSDSFADARVRPLVGLEISEGNFEDIPMGIFYVDNTTVERVKDRVTFSAYDKMIFLHFLLTETMRSNMKNMPPYAACAYVCSLASIQMAQTSAEVAAFPNGSVLPDYSDASIETARDLIMWCAQMMGCFARIDRHGKLEFVQLKAENDEHGMIIPAREIAARQRYSTKFADGVIRITRLTMKKSDGKMASAAVTYTGSTKRSAELELEQNPLILSLTDKTVRECLRDILSTVKTAYFRPFQSEIASDPALDAGDYVRLRGGSIDTNRGYGTGIITHNVWIYRGKHRIVNVGSVPAMYQLDDESSAAEIAAFSEIAPLSANSEDDSGSDDVDGTDLVYVPPKSQIEKELDAMRGKTGSGGGVGKATEGYPSSEYFNDYEHNIAEGNYNHAEGQNNVIRGGTANHADGQNNQVYSSSCSTVSGTSNVAANAFASGICGASNTLNGAQSSFAVGIANQLGRSALRTLISGSGNNVPSAMDSAVFGNGNTIEDCQWSLVEGSKNIVNGASGGLVAGNDNTVYAYGFPSVVIGDNNTLGTPSKQATRIYLMGYKLSVTTSNPSSAPMMVLGRYNQEGFLDDSKTALALVIGNGTTDSKRSSCFAVDYDGNVYCNKVIETGSKNIFEEAATQSEEPATLSARAITAAADAGIPINLLDHAPTAEDLTGSPCVFLQCEDTAEVEGETTGIFRVTDIFAEK